MEKKNITKEKTLAFAIRVVNLYKFLISSKHEFVMSKQLLKSGTSIGANCREADHAESPADFIHKLGVAQKEAGETMYWLELLHATEYLTDAEFQSIYKDAEGIYTMVTSSILTKKRKNLRDKTLLSSAILMSILLLL